VLQVYVAPLQRKQMPCRSYSRRRGRRWKGILLFHLITNPVLRFRELRRRVPGATQRMITLQLRELECDGCISQKVFSEVPPRVEYSITEFGRNATGYRRRE
jgi:DNA-binding HxlR family transcriptional regulator